METKRHLFLDLEDTVIEPVLKGWHATEMINVAKVKAFIAEFKPHEVHLFSFAVWDNQQKAMFQQGTQPMLEAALGIRLHSIPTVDDDIIPAVCNVLGLPRSSMDFDDLSTFCGKHDAFRHCMRNLFKHSSSLKELVLLDDAVYNETSEWPDLQVKLRILNIDQMKEPNDNDQPQT